MVNGMLFHSITVSHELETLKTLVPESIHACISCHSDDLQFTCQFRHSIALNERNIFCLDKPRLPFMNNFRYVVIIA